MSFLSNYAVVEQNAADADWLLWLSDGDVLGLVGVGVTIHWS